MRPYDKNQDQKGPIELVDLANNADDTMELDVAAETKQVMWRRCNNWSSWKSWGTSWANWTTGPVG